MTTPVVRIDSFVLFFCGFLPLTFAGIIPAGRLPFDVTGDLS